MIAHLTEDRFTDCTGPILCCYVNASSQIQVVRIDDSTMPYFERVTFPGQRLFFHAVPTAQLEVYTGTVASAVLADRVSCAQLIVEEPQL